MDQVAFLRELEHADNELGATLEELDELARDVQDVRTSAVALKAALDRLPAELVAAAAACEQAGREVEERRAAHERVLATKYSDEAEAQRDEVRARDLLHSAERRAEADAAEETRLAGEAEHVEREASELVGRMRELAARVDTDPPAETLDALAAWATATRAALFVRRAQVAAQREAVIRQANEVGSAVLGEPLVAQSAALVARRVEEAKA